MESFDLKYVIFLIATIVNVIIMLNLLISILGDSFDKFQVSANDIDYHEMADVITEIETVMFWNRRKNDTQHLIVCDIKKDPCRVNEGDWEGKISAFDKMLSNTINPIKHSIDEILIELKKRKN